MEKHKVPRHAQVVPTPLEEHLGEIYDPRGHEEKIAVAYDRLGSFIEDMNSGKQPQLTLDQVREATGTLGHFSGYPDEAYNMDCFLDSPLASSSYRAVAQALPSFIMNMNTLIQARIAKLSEQSNPQIPVARKATDDADLPF